MTYWVLAMKDGTPGDAPWGVAFGDYDKAAVQYERADYIDHGWKAKELVIFKTTTARQSEIDKVIETMNGEDA